MPRSILARVWAISCRREGALVFKRSQCCALASPYMYTITTFMPNKANEIWTESTMNVSSWPELMQTQITIEGFPL